MKPEPPETLAKSAPPSNRLVTPMSSLARFWVRFGSLCAGVLVVVLLNVVPLRFPGFDLSAVLVDWRTTIQTDGSETSEHHWFSVQAFLWVAFFLGLGEVGIRRQGVRAEAWLLKIGLLPEDERTMLTSDKLAPIYVRARTTAPDAMLPTVVRRLTMEFRKSLSVDRVNSMLNSSMELLLHQLDLRYTLLRYLVWIIPTLGFLGTVIGISNALEFVGSGHLPTEELLVPTTQKLGVAFHTTLLALLQSSVLMYGLNITQASEEGVLNRIGQYCLDNLVIRLTEPGHINKNA
jgi:biopolymer transport protein ExbB/TolQ